MKICLAQTQPHRGEIEKNISRHLELIHLAGKNQSALILFPELSLTGYEPALAASLAWDENHTLFRSLQHASDQSGIIICAGMPTTGKNQPRISMLIFQPGKPPIVYSKKLLHTDELPFFEPGEKDISLSVDQQTLTPAICFESMQPQHIEAALRHGTDIYLASVAKHAAGVEKAHAYFTRVSAQHTVTVMMVNSVGPCEDFTSAGRSAVWTAGLCMGALSAHAEGLLLFDTESKHVTAMPF